MFNLLAHSNDEWWEGAPAAFEMSRCVREYTDAAITQRLGSLDEASIAELIALPAIFAYEKPTEKDPKFGRITRIEKRVNRQEVRIDYEVIPMEGGRFLTSDELWGMEVELDLGPWECNRSHWAVKGIDLKRELASKGILLPPPFGFPAPAAAPTVAAAPFAVPRPPRVDITTHQFEVAFSFPGEYRPVVEAVARETLALLGTHSCFYDNNYQAQLAAPQLDLLLKAIYGQRAKLLVCFIGGDYQRKTWTRIEWDAIREVMATARHDRRIMYIRMDDGHVDGVSALDGYIDAQRFTPAQIAALIAERVEFTSPLAAPGDAVA